MTRININDLESPDLIDDTLIDGRLTANNFTPPKSINIRALLKWCEECNIDTEDLTEDQIKAFEIPN